MQTKSLLFNFKLFFTATLLFFSLNVFSQYYWVGGSGYWDDPNQWSYTSGGPGGYGVPWAGDDVYFDANSGFTNGNNIVTIQYDAYCNNMDWSGVQNTPVLVSQVPQWSSQPYMYVFGSFNLTHGMIWAFGGEVYFYSNGFINDINIAGQRFLSNIRFNDNGTGGGWILQSDLSMGDPNGPSEQVTIENGYFNSNGKSISCGYFYYYNWSYYGTLDVSNSVINIYYDLYMSLYGVTFDASGSTFNMKNSSNTFYFESDNTVVFNDINFQGDGGTAYFYNYTGVEAEYNNVNFAGNANLIGNSNKFNGSLTLSAGKTYTFQRGETQTIVGAFTANGTCSNSITFKSDVAGDQAIIYCDNPAVDVSYVNLQDISAAGSAVFTADNSNDMGNVSGWTINQSSFYGADLYWIGGGGNWSDPLHWSFTSGGQANPEGCIPGLSNNVYFDGNSGFTPVNNMVMVDNGTPLFKDMDWTGALNFPTFNASSYGLRCNGSLKFIEDMYVISNSSVYFVSSNTGNTIYTAGNAFQSVYFDGNGGGWTLMDDFTIKSYIYMARGAFNTNNKTVICGNFYSSYTNVRTINLGTSKLIIQASSSSGFHVNFSNLTFNGSSSDIVFSNTGSNGMNFNSPNSQAVFNNVEFNGSSTQISNTTTQTINFNNVVFRGSATVNGHNRFNGLLTLTPGYTYTFQFSRTQTLVGGLSANGQAGNYITIRSSSTSTSATFSRSSGCITGDYLRLRRMTGSGGATFYAGANSINDGNVSGWSFSNPPCQTAPAAVSISSNAGTDICSGSNVTFSAVALNAGASPSYQWKVNGGNVGSNSSTYTTSSLNNNDEVYCVVTPNCICVVGGAVTSSSLIMKVHPSLTHSVTISSNTGNTICNGDQVTFTANTVNGGGSPTWQWYHNGSPAGNSFQYITSSLNDGDDVYCITTSNLGGCITGSPATSNTLYTYVPGSLPVSVSISANPGISINAGTNVTFTANTVNAGNNASFVWYVNGQNMNVNSPVFTTSLLADNDIVSCEVNSSLGACLTGNPSLSDTLTMSVAGSPTLYWVGGSGLWHNPAKWSLTSGGSGGAGVPTAKINARFDANSGFTAVDKVVTVYGNAYCFDIDWTGVVNNPLFTNPLTSSNLRVSGSMKLIQNMVWNYSGKVYFEGTSAGNIIDMNNKQFLNDVYFEGINGEWTVIGNLLVPVSSVYVNSGYLNLDGTNSFIRYLYSTSGNTRKISCENAAITFWNVQLTAPNLTFEGTDSYMKFISSGLTITGTPANTSLVFNNNIDFTGGSNQPLSNNAGLQLSFKDVNFYNHGNLTGNNTFENLSFAAGKNYTIWGGHTQTVNGNFTANGYSCAQQTSIKSNFSGTAAIISKPSGAVNVDNVTLQDIHAVGGAVFNATNVLDLGNNLGWNISSNTSAYADFYWIGGSGNWSDPLHWSLTSGGTPIPGGCMPTKFNNVFFDANSGFAAGAGVTIDVADAYCGDMNWAGVTNNPVFNAGTQANNLRINGSLTLSSNMSWMINKPVYFESANAGETIYTAGNSFKNEVFFYGNGEYSLQDVFRTTGSISLVNGTLNSNDNSIIAYSLQSSGNNSRTLNLGNSSILLLSQWGGTGIHIHNDNINVDFSASSVSLVVTDEWSGFDIYVTSPQKGQVFEFGDVNFVLGYQGTAYVHNYDSTLLHFKTLRFNSNAYIFGSNTIDNLILKAGKEYNFEPLHTTTINNSISADWGYNWEWTSLYNQWSGDTAYFYKADGCIAMDFVNIFGIKAMGGAYFYAGSYSNDYGNTEGWLWETWDVPDIYSQPSDAVICEGNNAYFSVAASASYGSIIYQWYVSDDGGNSWNPVVDDAVYSNSSTENLEINAPDHSYNGNLYYCLINNNCNSHSDIVSLTVYPSFASVGAINGPAAACTGMTNVIYSNTIIGADTYLWTVPSGVNILSGQATDSLIVEFTGSLSGDITLTVSNLCYTSNPIILSIVVSGENTWAGYTDDWNDIANWSCGLVPDAGVSGIIPSVPVGGNFPVINTSGVSKCQNLGIEANAELIILNGSDFTLYGNILNNGNSYFGEGKIIFAGTAQNVNGTSAFEDIVVNAGSDVTMADPGQSASGILLINGLLNSNGNLKLIADASGSALIDGSGIGSINGTLYMQRYVPAVKAKGYKHFASAFSNATFSQFAGFMNLHLGGLGSVPYPTIFKYSEASAVNNFGEGWVAAAPQGQVNNTVEVATGYTTQFGSGLGNDITAELYGLVNNGNISIPVTRLNPGSIKGNGWNLVGNPYPSPIDLALLPYNTANLNKSVSIFISTSTYNGFYGYYNAALNIPLNGGTRHISALTGFFVQCNDIAGGNLTFTNSMRSNVKNPVLYKNELSTDKPYILLSGSNGIADEIKDETMILFAGDATDGFDGDFDISKLWNTSSNVCNLFSLAQGENLALNALNSEDLENGKIIPLGYFSEMSGNKFIEATSINGFDENTEIILEDVAKQVSQNLRHDSRYYFAYTSGESITGRFFLRIGNSSNSIVEEQSAPLFYAYSSENKIFISYNDKNNLPGYVEIFDALGRKIAERSSLTSGIYTIELNNPAGYYLLRFFNNTTTVTKKLYIAK